jgi:protein-S-isoprenylcysteine O-methyltransferase Ste14
VDRPTSQIADGAFALSRDPVIYVTFVTMVTGQFLIFPNWITLIYVGAATMVRLIREEEHMHGHCGNAI